MRVDLPLWAGFRDGCCRQRVATLFCGTTSGVEYGQGVVDPREADERRREPRSTHVGCEQGPWVLPPRTPSERVTQRGQHRGTCSRLSVTHLVPCPQGHCEHSHLNSDRLYSFLSTRKREREGKKSWPYQYVVLFPQPLQPQVQSHTCELWGCETGHCSHISIGTQNHLHTVRNE